MAGKRKRRDKEGKLEKHVEKRLMDENIRDSYLIKTTAASTISYRYIHRIIAETSSHNTVIIDRGIER